SQWLAAAPAQLVEQLGDAISLMEIGDRLTALEPIHGLDFRLNDLVFMGLPMTIAKTHDLPAVVDAAVNQGAIDLPLIVRAGRARGARQRDPGVLDLRLRIGRR